MYDNRALYIINVLSNRYQTMLLSTAKHLEYSVRIQFGL